MRTEGNMLGDPKECRLRALDCVQLGEETANREIRRMFVDLAHHWCRIAIELEDAQVRLEALNQAESASADLAATPWQG